MSYELWGMSDELCEWRCASEAVRGVSPQHAYAIAFGDDELFDDGDNYAALPRWISLKAIA